MTEYIDKTKLIADGWVLHRTYQQDAHTMVYESKEIADIPAADVSPVVHGRWIFEPGLIPHCSVCGRYSVDADTGDAKWCAFCGATMDKEDT